MASRERVSVCVRERDAHTHNTHIHIHTHREKEREMDGDKGEVRDVSGTARARPEVVSRRSRPYRLAGIGAVSHQIDDAVDEE